MSNTKERQLSKKAKPHPPFSVDLLRTGYFMLYENTGGWFGDMIQAHQLKAGLPPSRARFVHVDVLGPRQWAIQVVPPKSKIADICKTYRGRYACMVRYRALDYDKHRQYVAWWAATNTGRKYDWLGVLKFKIGWLFHWKNAFFCSENAAWALKQEYADAFKCFEPYEIFPGHFLGPQFEVVWEGVIT